MLRSAPVLQGWVVVLISLVYLGVLFAVASYGDRIRPGWMTGKGRPYIYALSLGVYCTSWTFFGSVGLASTSGLDFLPIYIGPVLMLTLGFPLVLRVVRLAKAQNITSIADFIAARYGKNRYVSMVVAIAAVIGALPYIALQLKAISISLGTVLSQGEMAPVLDEAGRTPIFGDLAMVVAVVLALFAILFGTRHVDATEHQDGLMLAIAMESLVKLFAFLVVGVFVVWGMFDGLEDLLVRAQESAALARMSAWPAADVWISTTVLAFVVAILLPRQFHVMVVENRSEAELRRAVWLYPLYLVAINLFVVPIALAGLILFADGGVDSDMFVLSLPLSEGANVIAVIAFLGGLSAATAMVIVETVALAIMISNDLAVPLLLRGRDADSPDIGRRLLDIRRAAIFVLLILAYIYYRAAGDAALAQIGLLSFAAIAQFAPAFFGGLIWKRATARGAIGGIIAGLAVWTYTLLLPNFADNGIVAADFIHDGMLGQSWLRPRALFGAELTPLAHGVMWSLIINVTVFFLLSLTRRPEPMERLQASAFAHRDFAPIPQSFQLWRATVTVGELEATVTRYLGEERAHASFESFFRSHGGNFDRRKEADIHLLRFAEHLLASAIGAASSRHVMSILLKRGNVSTKAALKLLDEASAAIQYSRDLLQTALDHAKQGITVFDKNLRLLCWNQEFRELLELPPDFLHVGVGLDEIIRFNAQRGLYGPGRVDDFVADRLERIITKLDTFRTRLHPSGRVMEIRSNRMPDGGTVTTYTDVTETVMSEEALERANETLERRVRERTRELTRLNQELERAKAEADEANISKTRFLAAASHDILQPLNAARLYVTSLVERSDGNDAPLAANVDASLEAVEEILSTLLDISRLDTGAMKPEMSRFRMDELMGQLEVEFRPLAQEKGLELIIVSSSVTVCSDRRLLRRLLQNLISNAIKYTPQGRVLVGCRRRGGRISVEVWDTGLGIPASKQRLIFKEFQRLEQGAKVARGLGLGLSIVERIARVLDLPVRVLSTPGKGSTFSIMLAVADPVAPAPPAAARVSTPATPLAGMHVLCIDNEPRILEGMDMLLSGWGCTVTTAAGLDDALALAGRGVPDVVLADYHLDSGDGLEAVRQLRAVWKAAVPGVLITADRSPAVREAAQALDLHILAKPVKPAALRALLTKWRLELPMPTDG